MDVDVSFLLTSSVEWPNSSSTAVCFGEALQNLSSIEVCPGVAWQDPIHLALLEDLLDLSSFSPLDEYLETPLLNSGQREESEGKSGGIGDGDEDEDEDRGETEGTYQDIADIPDFPREGNFDRDDLILEKALFAGLLPHFGHHNFKDGPLEALLALAQGHDVIATLPTGSGKSLIYQLFAMSRKRGVVLAIVPTRPIMLQQSKLVAGKGVYLQGDWKEQTGDILRGVYKVLYFAPEWLGSRDDASPFDTLRLKFLKDVKTQMG